MEMNKHSENEINDPLDQPWGEWLSELQTILGKSVVSFDGWGECYAAGLSPQEAIACRDSGEKRNHVIEYCSTSTSTHKLFFEEIT